MNLSQRRLFVLIIITFFIGSMLTYINYNESFTFLNKQRIVLSESDQNLINYLKSVKKYHMINSQNNYKNVEKMDYLINNNFTKIPIENKKSLNIEAIRQFKSTESSNLLEKIKSSSIKLSSTTLSSNQNLINKKIFNKSNNEFNNQINNLKKKNNNLINKVTFLPLDLKNNGKTIFILI